MPQAKSRRQELTALRPRVIKLEQELAQTQQQLIACQNATACLQADETLRLYKYALENSSDAIGFADGKGKHLYQNLAFGSLFECDRPEEFHAAGGMPARFINREIASEMLQTIINGASWAREVEMLSCKGRRFQAWARANAIRDESGGILGLIATISDITARKQAEEAVRVSQARFAGIVEIANDAIISLDSSQRITLFNKGAENIFGYTAAEVLGQPLSLLLPKRFAASHSHHVSNFAQSGQRSRQMGQRREIFGRRKDGTEFPAEASISHLELGGEIIFTAILRDISARIATEAALAQSNALLRSVMESTSDAIFVKDLQSRYVLVNSTTLELLGKYETETIGKTTEEIFGVEVADSLIEVDRRIIAKGEGETIEEKIADKNGGKRTLLTTKSPWRNQEGTVVGVVGIARDISDRQRQEESLRLMVEGTAAKTGEEFFRSCVRCLAEVLQVRYALISEFIDPSRSRVRTLAFWTGEGFADNRELAIAQSPCSQVIRDGLCRYPDSLPALCPASGIVGELGAKSYLGIAVADTEGNVLGNLCVLDTKPMQGNSQVEELILRIFAARAGAEIERKRAEDALREQARLSSFRVEVDSILACSDRLQNMLQQCTQAIVEHFDAAFARIWTLNEAENVLELQASAGMYTHIDGSHSRIRVGMYKIGAIAALKQPHLTNSVLEDPRVSNKEWAKREGMVAFAGYPLLVEDTLVGVVALFARDRLSDSVLEAISLVANEIAIGIKRKQAELALQASEAQLRQQTHNLEQTLRELQRTQSQLIQSEKMSSLGQLVAGVAHEINNPVSFIYGNLIHAHEYTQNILQIIHLYQKHYPQPVAEIQTEAEEMELDFLLEDLPKLLTSMQVGAERIQQIVLSLRTFSRMDEAQIKQVNIHDGIDSTLTILQNRLKAKPDRREIKVIKDYGNLPKVECYAGQLNQVFMNILCNAIDALEENHKSPPSVPPTSREDKEKSSFVMGHGKEDQSPIPTIRITTQLIETNQVIIRIADNGQGMTETVRKRLFDPFFTTKPVGKGTGMGLSISYQIITERHGGSLQCISSPGQGAEFAIQIPLKQ